MTFYNKKCKIVYSSTYHLKHLLASILTDTVITWCFVIYTNTYIYLFLWISTSNSWGCWEEENSHIVLCIFRPTKVLKTMMITLATLGVFKTSPTTQTCERKPSVLRVLHSLDKFWYTSHHQKLRTNANEPIYIWVTRDRETCPWP